MVTTTRTPASCGYNKDFRCRTLFLSSSSLHKGLEVRMRTNVQKKYHHPFRISVLSWFERAENNKTRGMFGTFLSIPIIITWNIICNSNTNFFFVKNSNNNSNGNNDDRNDDYADHPFCHRHGRDHVVRV